MYADEFLRALKNILDGFNTYHIPIVIDDKEIKDIEVEKDSEGKYKIKINLI